MIASVIMRTRRADDPLVAEASNRRVWRKASLYLTIFPCGIAKDFVPAVASEAWRAGLKSIRDPGFLAFLLGRSDRRE